MKEKKPKILVAVNVKNLRERDIPIEREIERVHEVVEQKVLHMEVELLTSYEPYLNWRPTPFDFLARWIVELERADYVVFVEGWQNSKSCRVKQFACQEYRIETIMLDEDNYYRGGRQYSLEGREKANVNKLRRQ